MLIVEPAKRLSIDQILRHKWITKESDPAFDSTLEKYGLSAEVAEEEPICDVVVDYMLQLPAFKRDDIVCVSIRLFFQ